MNRLSRIFNRKPQLERGMTFLGLLLTLSSIFMALFVFSWDIGRYYSHKNMIQSLADMAALAGINVVRRTFYVLPSDNENNGMTPRDKADAIRMAILEPPDESLSLVQNLVITYCPKSSEVSDDGFDGEGPCYNLSDSTGAYPSVASPSSFYPLESESTDDSAAYVHVAVTANIDTVFAKILTSKVFSSMTLSAMARAKEEETGEVCVGYFTEYQEGTSTDPQTINLGLASILQIEDGGMLISDELNNVFTSSGLGNEIHADWIRSVGDNAGPLICFRCPSGAACTNSSPCPQLDVPLYSIRGSEPDEPDFDQTYDCDSPGLIDTDELDCDMYNKDGRWFFVNCEVTNDNYSDVLTYLATGPNCGGLCAGTYCGGLTITNISSAANLVLNPLTSGSTVTDDVFYMVPRNKRADDTVTPKKDTPGKLTISQSVVVADDGGVDNAGVYIYAPFAPDGGYALELYGTAGKRSSLTGSLIFYADHAQLTRSTLSFTPQTLGRNPCHAPLELRTYLVL